MPTNFLELGPKAAPATILLAHGAGATMDSAGMTTIAGAVAERGLRIVRFESSYMANLRAEDTRKPCEVELVRAQCEKVPEEKARVQQRHLRNTVGDCLRSIAALPNRKEFLRWCQTNSNQSQFAPECMNLCGTKLTPLRECGGSVEFEIVA
ncbi:alpha/beta family hydrolase [Yoonia sediminilitoris]|uniref:KANL3/Tex30 alpha/beta hydrolase-like domain-containing protein n=1 Tax=Yoonia sediminilitoris TaxID=1286148 RepID=A0A2T6KAL0_9RHOB|nr:alpha/beta family hydrolase [Yoonia sediminilitoris]PUB11873.1 hypothetical protein C8N45_112116 [Yoonia sediminilitoris]RCW91950.1 hypothetical protein DFP92_112116 [Yoonia sediminilitoris]